MLPSEMENSKVQSDQQHQLAHGAPDSSCFHPVQKLYPHLCESNLHNNGNVEPNTAHQLQKSHELAFHYPSFLLLPARMHFLQFCLQSVPILPRVVLLLYFSMQDMPAMLLLPPHLHLLLLPQHTVPDLLHLPDSH